MPEIDMSVWTGRDDTPTEGPNALRWWQCVKPYTPDAEPGIVLIGFACDEGVRRNGGRVGAKDGPRALRKALANMAWQQGAIENERGTIPEKPVYDFGDVTCPDERLESAQDRLADAVAEILQIGHRPLVLGGGHETAWGTFQGVARAKPQATIGTVNIDSHLDLRSDSRATSGTPFKQISNWCKSTGKPFRYFCIGVSSPANTHALIRQAGDLGAEYVLDWDLSTVDPMSQGIDLAEPKELAAEFRKSQPMNRLYDFLRSVDYVYLSIDLDVLPAAVMPAVSAPAPRGINLETIDMLTRAVAWSESPLVAADIVELNPRFDQDERGAKTAAYLAWQLSYWWPVPSGPESRKRS